MRRTERAIAETDQMIEVLQGAKYASIAMCRDDEPYIVTMNYGYDEGRNALYFHCARQGLKIDFVTRNPTVCGTVIEDRGYLQGECAHAFRSVVFWGQMTIVDTLAEKKHAMEVMLGHLEDDPDEVRRTQLKDDESYERVGILRLDIHEISGKQGR